MTNIICTEKNFPAPDYPVSIVITTGSQLTGNQLSTVKYFTVAPKSSGKVLKMLLCPATYIMPSLLQCIVQEKLVSADGSVQASAPSM